MGITSAVEAYRESAYQNSEYGIERRIGAASIPVFGGFMGGLKQVGNMLWRPIKMGGALIFGGEYDASHVQPTEIPEDLKTTKLGENLGKLREHNRQAADLRAEGVGKMMEFKLQEGFRKYSAANHVDIQAEHVLFPEEAEARMKAEIMAEVRAEQRRKAIADMASGRDGADTPAFLRELLQRGNGGQQKDPGGKSL